MPEEPNLESIEKTEGEPETHDAKEQISENEERELSSEQQLKDAESKLLQELDVTFAKSIESLSTKDFTIRMLAKNFRELDSVIPSNVRYKRVMSDLFQSTINPNIRYLVKFGEETQDFRQQLRQKQELADTDLKRLENAHNQILQISKRFQEVSEEVTLKMRRLRSWADEGMRSRALRVRDAEDIVQASTRIILSLNRINEENIPLNISYFRTLHDRVDKLVQAKQKAATSE
jgi:hypothetical protein